MAFVQKSAVKALLEEGGIESLPLIFWDGELKLKGRYPTQLDRVSWLLAARMPA
ncbi:MAG: Arsenical resistance operon protein ArsD [Verrucomicrobiota bacterium]|jgi:hypothetical protein